MTDVNYQFIKEIRTEIYVLRGALGLWCHTLNWVFKWEMGSLFGSISISQLIDFYGGFNKKGPWSFWWAPNT